MPNRLNRVAWDMKHEALIGYRIYPGTRCDSRAAAASLVAHDRLRGSGVLLRWICVCSEKTAEVAGLVSVVSGRCLDIDFRGRCMPCHREMASRGASRCVVSSWNRPAKFAVGLFRTRHVLGAV